MTIESYYSNQQEKFSKKQLTESVIEGDYQDRTIHVNLGETYQKIDGFGGSFTDSSAYLIDQVLETTEKNKVMNHLFSHEEGIGLSVIRNPMGASDFSRTIYSYNDLTQGTKDEAQEHFSIKHDYESIIPLLHQAKQLNSDLKIFASPWSAPAWMKTNGSMIAGKLAETNYASYATYFVKFIQAYQAENLPIYGVTPQNEPLFVPPHYPGMEMLAHEQADFVKNYLRPAFEEAKLSTKIFGYDHNWDRIDYAFDLLDEASSAVDGIAWHWYGGRPVSQDRVHHFFPQKEVHFTEGSGGDWIPGFEKGFSNVMRTGIEIMRNHSKTFILWNMALDEKNGPTVPGFGTSICRGILEINQETKAVEYTLDYYALAHFSNFVKPGALRLGSNTIKEVSNTAFRNEDGSVVIVLYNDSLEEKELKITIGQSEFVVGIKGKTAMTVIKDRQQTSTFA